MSVSHTPPQEAEQDREIETIVAAVRQHGSMEIDALEGEVGGRSWGPGRFRSALRLALREQRVVRAGRGVIAAPDDAG